MSTNIGCKVIDVCIDECVNNVRLHRLAAEWNLVHIMQRQIETVSVISKQCEQIICCRLGETVGGD